MALDTTTIRPGLLVGLKTSITGNVSYFKTTLEDDHDEDGALVAKWETKRRIEDKEEHEAALKVRSKARSFITAICAQSSFGLLCPEDKTDKLEGALAEAQTLIREFNTTARITRINLYAITGRIAPDDVEAARALNSEVRDLFSTIEAGIANLDVKKVRDAANRARSVAQMLNPAAQERVQEAVDAARAAARKIVKAGDLVVQEIDKEAIAAIASARTAFLDLDGAKEVVAPEAEGRAVDLEPEVKREAGSYQPIAPRIEI